MQQSVTVSYQNRGLTLLSPSLCSDKTHTLLPHVTVHILNPYLTVDILILPSFIAFQKEITLYSSLKCTSVFMSSLVYTNLLKVDCKASYPK